MAAANTMIVCFGEMLIDFVPDVAGVSLAESGGFIKAPGGAPANVAVAITKLGGKSSFVGKVTKNVNFPPSFIDFIHWIDFFFSLSVILEENITFFWGVRLYWKL